MDVTAYIRLLVVITKEFHIPPSSFEEMPFWEYELFIEELNKEVKEDNDRQQKQMDEYEKNKPRMPKFNSNSFTQPKMPKIPTLGNMKL